MYSIKYKLLLKNLKIVEIMSKISKLKNHFKRGRRRIYEDKDYWFYNIRLSAG